MKDLIGKTAIISVPGVLDGQQELSGFDYSPDGTLLRWERMPPGVPHVHISTVSVHKEWPNKPARKATPAAERAVTLQDVPAEVVAQIEERIRRQYEKTASFPQVEPGNGGVAADARAQRGSQAPVFAPEPTEPEPAKPE